MNTFSRNPFKPSKKFVNIFDSIGRREQLEELQAPIIVVNQDSENDENITITWSNVTNAISYRVFINGLSVAVINTNTFSHVFTENGNFNVSVRAYAPNYQSSKYSNVVQVIVTNVGNFLSDGVLRFITANLKRILIKK